MLQSRTSASFGTQFSIPTPVEIGNELDSEAQFRFAASDWRARRLCADGHRLWWEKEDDRGGTGRQEQANANTSWSGWRSAREGDRKDNGSLDDETVEGERKASGIRGTQTENLRTNGISIGCGHGVLPDRLRKCGWCQLCPRHSGGDLVPALAHEER